MSSKAQQWIEYAKGAAALAALIVTVFFAPLCIWALSSVAESQRRIDVVEERVSDIAAMRETLNQIRIDVQSIRTRNDTRDDDINRRLEHIEQGLGVP